MVSIGSLPSNIAVSPTKLNSIEQNSPDKKDDKINISIKKDDVKKDDVKLQSFIKGAALSTISILAGVKFASNFSPSAQVLVGSMAVSVAVGAITASVIKNKGEDTDMEAIVAGASITGAVVGYFIGSKIDEGSNGAIAGMSVGAYVGMAAGKIMENKENKENKPEEQK